VIPQRNHARAHSSSRGKVADGHLPIRIRRRVEELRVVAARRHGGARLSLALPAPRRSPVDGLQGPRRAPEVRPDLRVKKPGIL
jgi:hypothetical protein